MGDGTGGHVAVCMHTEMGLPGRLRHGQPHGGWWRRLGLVGGDAGWAWVGGGHWALMV